MGKKRPLGRATVLLPILILEKSVSYWTLRSRSQEKRRNSVFRTIATSRSHPRRLLLFYLFILSFSLPLFLFLPFSLSLSISLLFSLILSYHFFSYNIVIGESIRKNRPVTVGGLLAAMYRVVSYRLYYISLIVLSLSIIIH